MLESMEPNLVTAPELAGILDELSHRESTLHWPQPGTPRDQLARMTVEDFWETGASGRRYSREFVLDELERRMAAPEQALWKISDWYCRKLTGDFYLLTYTLLQDGTRLTRRATLWQKTSDGWKAVYHQGTVVQQA